jgi:integrase
MIDKFNQITMQDSLARLRPHTDALIANTLIKCANDAITPITVKAIEYSLRQLSRKADLTQPEEVKNAIATSMNTKTHQPTAPETKNRLLFAYDKFCRYNEIKWEKPYYKSEEKTPLIPTPQNVQAIIDNSSEDYVCIFTIESEIGCSPEELYKTTQKDIDREKGEMSIIGVKGHVSKNYKLKSQTKELLNRYLARHQNEHPFPKAHTKPNVATIQRKSLSETTQARTEKHTTEKPQKLLRRKILQEPTNP